MNDGYVNPFSGFRPEHRPYRGVFFFFRRRDHKTREK